MLVKKIEHEALKIELRLGTQFSNIENGQEAPYIWVTTSSYELTLMDSQKQPLRSMVGRNTSSYQAPKQVTRKFLVRGSSYKIDDVVEKVIPDVPPLLREC